MGWRRVAVVPIAAVAGLLATVAPASAAVTEANGNTNPLTQNADGQCAAGQHWVYVSPALETMYNPLTKSTDSAGASQTAPPNSNADAYNDGVTVTLTDSTHASFSINEATDPNTTITVTKFVVKSGNHYTIYTGSDATPNTPRTSPQNATPPVMGVSHAYVCYTLTQGPPPDVPEVAYPAILVGAGAVIGGTILVLRRRRPNAA
jgi:hypothetical protein